MTATVYCVQYWTTKSPDRKDTTRPYETLGAARQQLARKLALGDYSGQEPYLVGRVLELTGEWVEVD